MNEVFTLPRCYAAFIGGYRWSGPPVGPILKVKAFQEYGGKSWVRGYIWNGVARDWHSGEEVKRGLGSTDRRVQAADAQVFYSG